MQTHGRPRLRPAWLLAAIVIGALALFLVDSLTLAQVGSTTGHISAVYPGTKIKSGSCREVGVSMPSGEVVLAQANDLMASCQLGQLVLVRHFRTRVLRLSSYEAAMPTRAGL
jgi:hypothetical protein